MDGLHGNGPAAGHLLADVALMPVLGSHEGARHKGYLPTRAVGNRQWVHDTDLLDSNDMLTSAIA